MFDFTYILTTSRARGAHTHTHVILEKVNITCQQFISTDLTII